MKKPILLSMSMVFLSVLGCSYPMEQLGLFKDTKIETPVGEMSADAVEINFAVVQERVLKSCNDCHSFTKSEDKVKANEADIVAKINGQGGGEIMPPPSKGYKPLNDCQKQILTTWLDDQKVGRSSSQIKDLSACGGGQSKPEPQPTPAATPTPAPTVAPTPEKPSVDFKTLEVNFATLKKEILDAKCMRCHEEGKAKATVLDTESQVRAQELVGKTAEESVLYQVVIPGMNKRFMPPVKSGIPALTAEEADYLKRYIDTLPPDEFAF